MVSDSQGCNRRRQRGAFTYFEMMIAMAVMGLVAALAVPRMGTTDSSKLRSAATVVVADLAYAQIESISHADNTRILVLNATSDGYSIVTASAPSTPITNPANNLAYTVKFGTSPMTKLSGVKISSYSLGGSNQIQFGMYGQTTTNASASTITLGCGARTLTISVDPTTGDTTVGSIN